MSQVELGLAFDNSSVEDNSSSIPGRCHRVESVITRLPTRLATMPTPSSSPVPPQNHQDLCQSLDSSIPILPRTSSWSSSGYYSDASSIQDEVFIDTDVVDEEQQTTKTFKEELDNIKELLAVSNEEIGRLKAANDSLQAKELELLERQVVAQETMASQVLRKADSKRKDALVEAKAKANSILFYVEELDKAVNKT